MPKSLRITVILKRAKSSTTNYTMAFFWKLKEDGTYDKFKVEKLQEGEDKLKELKE
jgi:hypothetical protein